MSAFTDLLADPYAARRYLVILEPYDPGASAVVTLYHSDHGFVTKPTDSPASQYFEPRVVSALNFERHLFQRGLIGGRSIPNFGEIALADAVAALLAEEMTKAFASTFPQAPIIGLVDVKVAFSWGDLK